MIDAILSQSGFFTIIILYAIGACGSLILHGHDEIANVWGNMFAAAGSLGGLIFSAYVVTSGKILQYVIPSPMPLLTYSIRIDALSAFFMGIICLLSFLCSIYAFGYVRNFFKHYNIGILSFFYNIFIASMILVVTANHALYFLIVWELMALSSYMLVIFERHKTENVRAGSLYFIMTHCGTACIILAFLLIYQFVGSFDFDEIRKSYSLIPSLVTDAIFISALIGFGIKCGIIPLHIWLPAAHPAAPSHVSALLSGVMIKTGIYMLIRICFDFFHGIPQWWGLVILILGMISSIVGVLYALAEHDMKRLLAYHSIENIGIIFLGLGSSLVFASAHMNALAVLSCVAALYHTVNHALFKALLFMGAGSVISATHTHNIEEYGGLLKRMPYTAFFFLIGSLAISAMPPFNGFVSEWLIFQSLFQGVLSLHLLPKIFYVLGIAALGLTGGLAAACFVKAFGITFLARPRSKHALHARETSNSMILGMAFCAFLTIFFGIGAGFISNALQGIVRQLYPFANDHIFSITHAFLSVGNNFAILSMPFTALGLGVCMCILLVAVSVLFSRTKICYGRTWDCGSDLTSRMEITATGFSRSLVVIFKNILFPIKKVTTEYADSRAHYFPLRTTTTLTLLDIYQKRMYGILARGIAIFSEKARTIQSGNINMYIVYIFAALMALLTTLAL